MSKMRIFLITLIALVVAGTVMATKLYEYTILSSNANFTAQVRPSYKLFEEKADQFSFHYPLSWSYEPIIETTDTISGIFVTADHKQKLYLETPFSGRGFLFYKRVDGSQMYLDPPQAAKLPTPVVLATSQLISTNDANTSIVLEIYRPCLQSAPVGCKPAESGGFIVGYWERNNTAPVLSSEAYQSVGHDVSVLYSPLADTVSASAAQEISFVRILQSLAFVKPAVPTTPSGSATSVYVNEEWQYALSYPPGAAVKENTNFDSLAMATGTAVVLGAKLQEGTNLREAYVAIATVVPEYMKTNCLVPLNNDEVTTTIVNGISFTVSKGADAGAGNFYENTTYATVRNNQCLQLRLQLHSVNVFNYDATNRPKEFDRTAVAKQFEAIISSFHFLANEQH